MALTAKKVYAILKRQISDMEAKLNSPVRYRGTVATADLLPLNPDIGDMYNIESKSIYGEAGMNVAWNGVVWDTMGAPIDMSLYFTKEEAEAVIQRLVTEYFEKNPVKPGATAEQVQQIEQNKTDIGSLKEETGSLKEDLSNKITKFYASNQGETHITDSDNGKIQDMQIFGRSEQKKYNGYQLLALAPINLSTGEKASLPYTEKGITVDIANDGIGYTVRGTNTLNEQEFDIYLSMPSAFDIEAGTYTRSGKIINGNSNVELVSGGGASSGGCLEYKASKVDFTFTETVKKGKSGNFIIRISPSATVNAIVYFQIEKGSEAHGFEPYTGGQPSPSPDYPQVIKSVVNPMVRVFGGTLGNKLNNKQINWLIENMNIWHDNNHFVLYDEYGTAGSVRLIVCNYENNTNNYTCIFIDTDRNITHGAYQFDSINNIENKFIYCNMLLITDIHNISMVMDVDSNKTVGLPDNYQTIQYTLNAVPVSSGGNITINGQQYIADYVDVEREKLVRMCERTTLNTKNGEINEEYRLAIDIDIAAQNDGSKECIFSTFEWTGRGTCVAGTKLYIKNIKKSNNELYTAQELKELGLDFDAIYQLAEKQEIDLTTEQITAFKELVTYYPVTNVSVNSEQLDGYTVFNYPISMANGWNYVKKQLNDNRDYIYDMDAQSAEAYVNSEYAVALTELEV